MGLKISKPIEINPEAKKISTPEPIAHHIAKQLRKFNNAVELCCGVGTISIQLAKIIPKVYGIDINNKKIISAKNNAKMYNIENKTQFILGDVLNKQLLKKIKAEVSILDPSWTTSDGTYAKGPEFTTPNLTKLWELIEINITKNIVIRVPPTFTKGILNKFGVCRVENIYWNDILKFKIAYFLESTKKYQKKDLFF